MLTKEQETQARIALLKRQSIDLQKHIAFENHKTAMRWAHEYMIPYRIGLDILKNPEYGNGPDAKHTYPNPCYPLPGYPRKELLTYVYPDDFIEDEQTNNDEEMTGFYPVQGLRLNTEYDRQAQEHAKQFRKWLELFTPEWEYCFFHLFEGYDFNTFTEFDFFGTKDKETDSDIALMQKVYSRYQAEYIASKDKYLNIEPIYTPDEKELYTDIYFNYILDKDTFRANEELDKQLRITHTDTETVTVNGIECIRDISK